MNAHSQIMLVGFGHMGRALVEGWLSRGHGTDAIQVVDPSPRAREEAAALGLAAWEHAPAHGHGPLPDVVVIAVKPVHVAVTVASYRAYSGTSLFLSIVAGKPIRTFTRLLGDAAVVRAMPNTPAAIGRGMTVLCANAAVAESGRSLCDRLMSAVGVTAWVDDEALMDAVTALSGSGPAYVFALIEAMIAAGEDLGLGPQLARQLAEQTVAGAGAYAVQAGLPASELRRRVTSPGGTTEAALAVLMADPGGLTELLRTAVERAAARSRELSAD